ncbi:putative protein kinase-like domain superfamily [Helianthus annuus]|uniref:Aminoglycoside phosphotransferase domain-containing protein n=1 Tax=Helianthus annuus TaxID=4232 RepID=A0A251VQX4_HELAN|nr:putative protein kinase-like domain superfamily [Helianthus annuus]
MRMFGTTTVNGRLKGGQNNTLLLLVKENPKGTPKMLTLIDWIRENISSEDSSGSTAGLLHGDFRMDNLVFHPIEGRQWPVAGWKFYIAFSLFRGASILAGVHSRYIMGNALGGKRAQDAGEKANGLIQIAWSYIQRENVLSQSSICYKRKR